MLFADIAAAGRRRVHDDSSDHAFYLYQYYFLIRSVVQKDTLSCIYCTLLLVVLRVCFCCIAACSKCRTFSLIPSILHSSNADDSSSAQIAAQQFALGHRAGTKTRHQLQPERSDRSRQNYTMQKTPHIRPLHPRARRIRSANYQPFPKRGRQKRLVGFKAAMARLTQ